MGFASRQEAGRQLGCRLRELAIDVDLVAGLPRGGVVVAAEVAEALQLPLSVLVVRKIGHPAHREFAVGALAEDGVLVLDRDAIRVYPLAEASLRAVIEEEKERLLQYYRKFHRDASWPGKELFAGRRVLLVDDGLATGATAEAAILSLRAKQAREIILAVPVASVDACTRLARMASEVVTLIADPDFASVGQYYREFSETGDEEVLALLHGQHAH